MISYNSFIWKNINPVILFWFWLAGWSYAENGPWYRGIYCGGNMEKLSIVNKTLSTHKCIHRLYHTTLITYIQGNIDPAAILVLVGCKVKGVVLSYTQAFTLVKWGNQPEWYICHKCEMMMSKYTNSQTVSKLKHQNTETLSLLLTIYQGGVAKSQ